MTRFAFLFFCIGSFFAQALPCKISFTNNNIIPPLSLRNNPVYQYIYHLSLNPDSPQNLKVNFADISTQDFVDFFNQLEKDFILERIKIKNNKYKDVSDIFYGIHQLEEDFWRAHGLYNFLSFNYDRTELELVEKSIKKILSPSWVGDMVHKLDALRKKTAKNRTLNPNQLRIIRNVLSQHVSEQNDPETSDLRDLYKTLQKQEKFLKTTKRKERERSDFYVENKKLLKGLGKEWIKRAYQRSVNRGHEGKYHVKANYRRYRQIGKIQNRNLRKKLYEASVSDRAESLQVIKEILNTKHEIAKHYGFSNYMDYYWSQLESFSETPRKAINFLKSLIKETKHYAERDLKEWELRAKKHDKIDSLQFWDIPYYDRIFDGRQKLKISIPELIEVTFKHFKNLLGIEFKENRSFPAYKEGVEVYNVYYKGRNKGILVLDLFTDGKTNDPHSDGYLINISPSQYLNHRLPISLLKTYFNKEKGMVKRDKIRIFFHEMGHAIQNHLTQDLELVAFTQNSIEQIEFYSSLQEVFLLESDTLNLFNVHKGGGGVASQLSVNYKWSPVQVLEEAYAELLNLSLHLKANIKDLRQYEEELIDSLNLSPYLGDYLFKWNAMVNYLSFVYDSSPNTDIFKKDFDILENYGYLYSKAVAVYFLNQYRDHSGRKNFYDNASFKRRLASLYRNPYLTLKQLKKSGKGTVSNQTLVRGFVKAYFGEF